MISEASLKVDIYAGPASDRSWKDEGVGKVEEGGGGWVGSLKKRGEKKEKSSVRDCAGGTIQL